MSVNRVIAKGGNYVEILYTFFSE